MKLMAIPLALLLLVLSASPSASNWADSACQDVLDADTDYPPAGRLICPPTLAEAEVDNRFFVDPTMTIELLTQWHPGADKCYIQEDPAPCGSVQQCCYANGTIYMAIPGAGIGFKYAPFVLEYTADHLFCDTRPWYYCCHFSSNISHYCQEYYSHRPANDGTNYVPPP